MTFILVGFIFRTPNNGVDNAAKGCGLYGDSLGSIRGEFGYAQIRDRSPGARRQRPPPVRVRVNACLECDMNLSIGVRVGVGRASMDF